jgi:hypothetical protein
MNAVHISVVFAFLLCFGCGDDAQVTKRYIVDLDDEPEDRWNHVMEDYVAFVTTDLKEALLLVTVTPFPYRYMNFAE